MSVFRKLFLMGIAALAVSASLASSASALTAVDDPGGTAIAVGQSVTGTTDGHSTLTGSFFGFSVTVSCAHSSVHGTVTANGGAVVQGSITHATWSGCFSNYKNPCSVTATGLPWTPSGNEGGLAATSTTSVGVSPGTTGSVNVTDCMPAGSTCEMTGSTANYGGLVNVVVGSWTNTTTAPQLTLGTANNVKSGGAGCSATNPHWVAKYTLKHNGVAVSLQ